MRDKRKHRLALLVTDDAAVETAVRREAASTGEQIELLRSSSAAMSVMIDGCGDERFAIVDLEGRHGRRLLETAGGLLPVLALSRKPSRWLSSMVRRHRIGVSLVKPFTAPQLHEAWQRAHTLLPRVGRSV